jgi:chorismate synthase
VPGAGPHNVEPSDVDSNAVLNSAGLKSSEDGVGNQSISSDADEHGAPPMQGDGVKDIEPSSTAHAVLSSGAADALGLGDSFHFKDATSGSGVSGPAAPDQSASISHHDDATGTHGSLSVGPQTLDLPPPPVLADDLSIAPDHGMGHLVTHVQHDLIV